MRTSNLLFRTLRELPEDADSISYQYLLRAGFIQRVASGIFSYLPLGWSAIQNIRAIINEEMRRAGGQEINMPVVQPRDLWQQSGRIDTFIPPLSVFEDRRGRKMLLAPTHEETVSTMARYAITSYRDMPRIVYQIQTKFRDELRSRGGLLRVREFEMKDAYSFDADEAGLDHSFQLMRTAYRRIFDRCGVTTLEVDADSGGIGGKESKEFVMLAENGEDVVLTCRNSACQYAANSEKAAFAKRKAAPEEPLPMETFATPDVPTIEALAKFCDVPSARTAKAVFYHDGETVLLVIVRGDYDINETKLKNTLGGTPIRLAEREEAVAAGLVPGYTSAVNVDDRVKVIIDDSVAQSPNLIGGANKPGYHIRNVNYPRDFKAAIVADIAQAEVDFDCILCGDKLESQRGIEVGHIFKLGKVYSDSMNIRFQDRNGRSAEPLMGCYGLGLGRLLAAIIEGSHDEYGMILPHQVAPYKATIIALNMKKETVKSNADALYEQLSDCEVLYDDRLESPGVKFKDAELVGTPLQIVLSERNLQDGYVELKLRGTEEKHKVKFSDTAEIVKYYCDSGSLKINQEPVP